MEVSEICPVCNFETETIIHCLISCGLARDCWQRLGVPVISPGERGFIEWLEKIVGCDLEVQVEEVVVVLWHLWFNRNKIIWRNENGSATGIIGAARNCLTAWREAQVQTGEWGGRPHLEEKWVKP
ncbi:uncharacterized protein LOC121749420 [Salvia splendens]|uniref:uncharacterized protein LOC121749420 n=1 Tax=Salvia splendens TaxID=180675 RepID=UPI001C25AC1B|nr:uncharacterized protein LOC121749420 [Salvia splendens]